MKKFLRKFKNIHKKLWIKNKEFVSAFDAFIKRDKARLLFFKYRGIPRHTPLTITYENYSFKTPDVPSALCQIKDYFIDDKLRFEEETDKPVIISCGADIGVTAVYFKKIFPKAKITSVEADPKIIPYLKENLANNNAEDVEVIGKAVWTDDKEVEFSQDGADGGSILKKAGSSIKVPSITLSELLRRHKIIHLLKIDIEGAETDVLLEAKDELKNVRNIAVEYHSWRNKKQSLDIILKLLSDNGFRYTAEWQGAAHPFQCLTGKCDDCPDMDFQLNIYATKTEN